MTSGSMTSGSMRRSALVTIVLVTMVQSGSAAEKLSSCCESVGKDPITAPILSFMVQAPKPPCVKAVIFQTEQGLFCSPLKAAWVHKKIQDFREANAQKATVSPVSLLSIITSTASPSSSLPSSPSSSSVSPSSSSPSVSPSLSSSSEVPEAWTSIFSTSSR